MDQLGFKNTSMDMILQVENPNVFPLKMKDGRYTVTGDKTIKMQGAMEKIVNIHAKGRKT